MSESKPYRPSNGSEGMAFEAAFCADCHYEDRDRNDPLDMSDGCNILARALAFQIGDPEYPKEWIRDPDPRCTYFRKLGTGSHEDAARDKAKYDEAMAAMKAAS